MHKHIAIVPVHGIGVRGKSPLSTPLADSMLSALRAIRPDFAIYSVHDPIKDAQTLPSCMCLQKLPAPYHRIVADDTMIDFREPVWGSKVNRKRFDEIVMWVRRATKVLPVQSRHNGIAKGAAESATTLLLFALAIFTFFTPLGLIAGLLSEPTVIARIEYAIFALIQWSFAEMMVTILYENYILRNRIRFIQLRRENDLAKFLAGVATVIPHVNLRTSWKWLLLCSAGSTMILLLSRSWGGGMTAALMSLTALHPAPALWIFPIARRIPRLVPSVIWPFSDLVSYASDERAMAEIRQYLAQFIARLCRETRQAEVFSRYEATRRA